MPDPQSEQTVSVPRTAPPRAGSLPKSVHIPGAILLAMCWAAWLLHYPSGGDMRDWGISSAALLQGRYETIILHMFAHAGLLHISMNSLVLFSFAGPLVWAMGSGLAGSVRFTVFYLISGLCGGALYVALNAGDNIPAVGASGAISGMIGFVARLDAGKRLLPVFSRELGSRIWEFVKANLILIAIFAIPMLLGGSGMLIAWEGHLGGFLFGLFAASLFLKPAHG